MNKLSHLDMQGKVKMVDVSDKKETERRARASCSVLMKNDTLDLIIAGRVPKGDVLATAKIAGIMAAKKTAELIPMCHALNVTGIDLSFKRAGDDELRIEAEVKIKGVTGVEMEALTACSVAALTVYDMVKSVEKGVRITDLHLLEKEGGKSAKWQSGKGEVQ